MRNLKKNVIILNIDLSNYYKVIFTFSFYFHLNAYFLNISKIKFEKIEM